jgi:hypothetical protein
MPITFDINHLEPAQQELIEEHFDLDLKEDSWVNFLSQFLDFQIVKLKETGEYVAINYNASLEGSTQFLTWGSLLQGDGYYRKVSNE